MIKKLQSNQKAGSLTGDLRRKGSDVKRKGSDFRRKGSDVKRKGSDVKRKGSDVRRRPGRQYVSDAGMRRLN